MSTNGSGNPTADTKSTASDQDLSKDQVGWYFVEQYYNTVSKNPEKLHLFYGKTSQFVYGIEAEVTNISVGRHDIQEKIKTLDFQDCKVRISNVDTQGSFDNIVIQVIGEFSNKGGEPKKFVQTFVLAEQPSGYFVLNDILRYIDEDIEEEVEPQEAEPAPELVPTEESAEEPAEEPAEETTTEESKGAFDAEVIDKKLEEVSAITSQDTPAAISAVETPVEAVEPQETKTEASTEPTPDPDTTAKEIAEEDAREPEKPKDPSPTPVAARASPPEAPKPAVSIPPKPMTWANRVAAGAPKPVVPLKAATPPAPAQSRAPAPTVSQPAASKPAEAPAPAETPAPAPARKESQAGEWQTAGSNSKQHSRPQSTMTSDNFNPNSCYIKFVTDKVNQDDLKAALAAHGELVYFDINRQKNCAFCEFATAQGFHAAIKASPYTVNGEAIVVEPRKRTPNIGGGRGGAARSGGRPYANEGRSPSNRGTYGQGRGGRGTGRPRGGPQATNT